MLFCNIPTRVWGTTPQWGALVFPSGTGTGTLWKVSTLQLLVLNWLKDISSSRATWLDIFCFQSFWISVLQIRDYRHILVLSGILNIIRTVTPLYYSVFESLFVSWFVKEWVHQKFFKVHRKIHWLRRSPCWPWGAAWHILSPLPHFPSGQRIVPQTMGQDFSKELSCPHEEYRLFRETKNRWNKWIWGKKM